MSPNAEQMILAKLDVMEERQISQGNDIAEIKGKMAVQDRHCDERHRDVDGNFDEVFGRLREVEISRAKNAGVQVGKQQAGEEVAKNKRLKAAIIAAAFTAGAALVEMWPQIKKVLAMLVSP